jgi:hypothetical protein
MYDLLEAGILARLVSKTIGWQATVGLPDGRRAM